MRFTKNYILLNFIAWTLVMLFDLAGDYFTDVFWERPFYWLEELPFVTSWYIWFLLTPLGVMFGRKYLYEKNSANKFILYHFGFYIIINVIQIVLVAGYLAFMFHFLFEKGSFKVFFYKTAISGSFYNFIIYFIILLLINGLKYYKDLQEEKNKTHQLEKKLTESRMQFLKQQLQPHFLFNTHHSIITLMKLGLINKAVEMMEKLSDLIRFALKEDIQQEVTVEKELSLLQLYLDIQKIRFEDKLLTEYEIDEPVLKALVPTMILQPIVENAIKYAVETSAGNTSVIISAKKSAGDLLLSIKDKNLTPQLLLEINRGIGINNTQERLQKLYGNKQCFKLKQFKDGISGGLEVTIKIPLHYA